MSQRLPNRFLGRPRTSRSTDNLPAPHHRNRQQAFFLKESNKNPILRKSKTRAIGKQQWLLRRYHHVQQN